MKRVLWALPVAVAAVSAAAVASAHPSGAPNLTGLSAANTRSPGFAPATRLSPQLSQTAVAQGATKLENPSAQIAYYGYDSDQVNAAGEPIMVPTPERPDGRGAQDRAGQEHLPGLQEGSARRGPEL